MTLRTLTLPCFALALSALVCCSSSGPVDPVGSPDLGGPPDAGGAVLPPWLSAARVFVSGYDLPSEDCRRAICQHNENTDLVRFHGALYLVHRSALSQILGPNSALHIYRSTDDGMTFTPTAVLAAPTNKLATLDRPDQATAGRDLRDPHFYVVGDTLRLKALTRLPVTSPRDSNVDTIAVGSASSDGEHWTALQAIGPTGYSFWRIKESAGVYYSAAYADGDQSVTLFSSRDGVSWQKGALIYDVAADTPLETELEFLPSGKLLALVRMDGTDNELFGSQGRLRTKVCWASPPYTSFGCTSELSGQRLDGPLSLQWQGRLFVVARRHLQPTYKKRTTLFELTGDFTGGALAIAPLGDLPSAGDTSYAGGVMMDGHQLLLSWYSGDVNTDTDWLLGMLGQSDIWLGTVDLAQVPAPKPTTMRTGAQR